LPYDVMFVATLLVSLAAVTESWLEQSGAMNWICHLLYVLSRALLEVFLVNSFSS